jgi:catechol 2,3-dioxygenase-like lactoylglutathione lyase family enzyme
VIDHIGIGVGDYERSKRFFAEALGPLGYELVMEPVENVGGFAAKNKPDFWIEGGNKAGGTHVAFAADDRATVDAFHAAALAAGGADNGQPGLRPITSTTTAPTSTIRTGTTSRRSATYRSRWRSSVEPTGLEPVASSLPDWRSPS